jgi:hypothetical protein
VRTTVAVFISTVLDFRRKATGDLDGAIRSSIPRGQRTSSNPVAREVFYRHRLPVRLTHWINALCILFLLGSGLNIFNAHPRLYWGLYGADADKPLFAIGSEDASAGILSLRRRTFERFPPRLSTMSN